MRIASSPERAKARGTRTVLDLAPAGPVPEPVLDALDVLVVNEIEAAPAAGVPGDDPLALARDLARRHHLACIVTLGAQGAIAVTADGGWQVGVLPVEAVDTTGAGDAFTGVLAAALDLGEPLPRALHRASVAAGLLHTGRRPDRPARGDCHRGPPRPAPRAGALALTWRRLRMSGRG